MLIPVGQYGISFYIFLLKHQDSLLVDGRWRWAFPFSAFILPKIRVKDNIEFHEIFTCSGSPRRHPADTNNDHLQTSMACQEAIRLFQRRPEVKRVKEFWYMEVPSCTEWKINNAMKCFEPNCYVEVGKEGVDAKIKALGMYRGVMRPYPHPRSAEYITGLAAVRGGQWGVNYAEAFEVVQREY